MAERFTRVASLPKNQYLAGSPVILQGGSLYRGSQTGNQVLRLKMRNLSYYGILAMTVTVILTDGAGQRQQVAYTYPDLAANTDEAFGERESIPLPRGEIARCTVRVDTVSLADGSLWRNETGGELTPLPRQQQMEKLLKDEVLLQQYRRETTDRAQYLPAVYKELWLCACGGINSRERQTCVHCGVALEDLKQITGRKDLVLEKRRFDRRKRRFHRQNHRRRRWTAWALAALVLLVTGLLFVSKAQREKTAETLAPYCDGAFREYRELFLEGTGMDSSEVAFDVTYQSQELEGRHYTVKGEYLCRAGSYTSHTPFLLTGHLDGWEQELTLEDEYVTDESGRRIMG